MKSNSSFKKHGIILIVYVFIIQYLNIGLVVDGMNVLYPALEQAHGWSVLQTGGATSIAVYISMVTAIIIGTLMMRKGLKKILIPATILLGLDVIVMGRTANFQVFAVTMVVLQVLAFALVTGSVGICANWFVKGRGKILGIVTIGCPVASATFVTIGTKASQSIGYSNFYTIFGLLIVLHGIAGIWLVKERPEVLGLNPDGEDKHVDQIEERKDTTNWSFSMMVKNKEMWLIAFGWGFIFLMMTGIMVNAIARFTQVGISLDKALAMFSIASFLGIPASYFWGWLDDKVSTPKACAIFACSYILGSVCFLFGSADNMAVAFGGILAIALTTGGMPNLQPSLQAWVYGREEFVPTGRYTGVVHNIFRGSAFGFAGLIVTKTGSFDGMYVVFSVLSVLTVICFLLIKVSYDPEREGSLPLPGQEKVVSAEPVIE